MPRATRANLWTGIQHMMPEGAELAHPGTEPTSPAVSPTQNRNVTLLEERQHGQVPSSGTPFPARALRGEPTGRSGARG